MGQEAVRANGRVSVQRAEASPGCIVSLWAPKAGLVDVLPAGLRATLFKGLVGSLPVFFFAEKAVCAAAD